MTTMDQMDYSLDRIFYALCDPTRRALFQAIAEKSRSVTELAQPFKMSLAAVSKHLRVLESALLIRRSRAGRMHQFAINAEALLTAEQWIATYEQFWGQKLDSLAKFLEKPDQTTKKEGS